MCIMENNYAVRHRGACFKQSQTGGRRNRRFFLSSETRDDEGLRGSKKLNDF